MGRLTLILRLAVRDLRYRRAETALLLLAITAATATLTLGLALSGVTSQPYQQTRAATRGPDIVASFLNLGAIPKGVTTASGLAALQALAKEPGVAASSGPYPVSWPVVRVNGHTAGVLAEGRDQAPASIDRPELVQGSWVRPGAVVVERSFADALGVRIGQRLTLNGRPFTVAGIAVSAANVPYPQANFVTYGSPYPTSEFGTMWLTRADATSLATRALPLSYLLDLRLLHPAQAEAFESARSGARYSNLALSSWQDISRQDSNTVLVEQRALVFGSSLLALLAIATVSVLVGGRMAEQTRRVGLLKAVGGTPKLIAAVLLAQNLLAALAAAAAGLATGWLAAPLLTSPGTGLVGTAGAPSFTLTTVEVVTGLSVGVAVLATFIPALRAARTSTVAALADSARPPRRRGWLIRLSRRLPVPLLLGLRWSARRPRRLALTATSVTITVATVVAVLAVHTHLQLPRGGYSALSNPRDDRVDQVLLVVTIVLIALAAVNALFITWATVLDARQSAALARALGATDRQVSAGLSSALLLPSLAGAIAGIPAGVWLLAFLSHGGALDAPPGWILVAVAAGTLAGLAGLTAIPARAGARRMPAEVLGSQSP